MCRWGTLSSLVYFKAVMSQESEEWFCSLLWQVFLDDLQSPSLHCGPPSLASLSQWLEDQVPRSGLVLIAVPVTRIRVGVRSEA